MDVRPSLVPHPQPPEPAQPRQCPFHHPAMPAQPFRRLPSPAGDPTLNAAPPQISPALGEVVPLVRVQLRGPLSPLASGATDARDGRDYRLEALAVVDVGRRERDREGDAPAVDHQVALRARLAAVRRIRPGRFTPLFAGALALSRLARLQSIWSASPSRSSRRCKSWSHTPACCQSRRRRQQVTPLPQPISCGSISQGMPLLRTNRMPVSAARSVTRGRPPLGLGGSGGRRGAMASHNASVTIACPIPPRYPTSPPLARF